MKKTEKHKLCDCVANEGKSGQVYDDYLTTLVSSLGNSFSTGYTAPSYGFGGGR